MEEEMRALIFMMGFLVTFTTIVASANFIITPTTEIARSNSGFDSQKSDKLEKFKKEDNSSELKDGGSMNPNPRFISSTGPANPLRRLDANIGEYIPKKYNCLPETNMGKCYPKVYNSQPNTNYVYPNLNCNKTYTYSNQRLPNTSNCNNYRYLHYNRCGWNFPVLRGLRNLFFR